MKQKLLIFHFSFLILFILQGCILLSPELLTLKRVRDSQKEIGSYLARQAELFNKLIDDLKNGQLKPGISKRRVIKLYSEPVLITEKRGPEPGEILLYRHPTRYFNSDRIYLHFDEAQKLIGWEYEPITSIDKG